MSKKILITIIIILVVIIALIVAFCINTQRGVSNSSNTNPPAGSVISSAGFYCDGGKSIRAVFMTDSAEITLSDGRTMNLAHALSADGGRYTNNDESFVFWTKGNGAFVQENGTTTYENCIVANQN